MSEVLRALHPDHIPHRYEFNLRKEKEFIEGLLKDKQKIKELLEIGCGRGRLTPGIKKHTDKYVGVDIDSAVLAYAENSYGHVKDISFQKVDARKLTEHFKKEFDVTICAWGTLGCIPEYEKAISEILQVTKDTIYLSFIQKSYSAYEMRRQYYKDMHIDHKADDFSQTITSNVWGKVQAYTEEMIYPLFRKFGVRPEIYQIEELLYGVVIQK